MPKNTVSDPITDQEMAYAHLLMSGTMTDRRAAEAVGLNPDTAAYTQSKPVRDYMIEHRNAVREKLAQTPARSYQIAEPPAREKILHPAKNGQHPKAAEKSGAGLVSPVRCGSHSAVKSSPAAYGEGTHGDSGSAPHCCLSRGAFRSEPLTTHAMELSINGDRDGNDESHQPHHLQRS